MMFRRFLDRLRHQEWFAVLIELLIVIVGVFIGIQVSNWNEDRVTNQKAAVFTARLVQDMREEAWNRQALLEYYEDVKVNAERAVDALEGRKPLSDEALLIAAYRATQYTQNTRRRATFDELTSTGNIGLIRDDALRDLAMRVYTMPVYEDAAREGINSPYRRAFRMTLPIAMQRQIANACGDRIVNVNDYKAIVDSLDYPCKTALAPDEIARGAAKLRASPDLAPLLNLRIADIETRIGDLNQFNPQVWINLAAYEPGHAKAAR